MMEDYNWKRQKESEVLEKRLVFPFIVHHLKFISLRNLGLKNLLTNIHIPKSTRLFNYLHSTIRNSVPCLNLHTNSPTLSPTPLEFQEFVTSAVLPIAQIHSNNWLEKQLTSFDPHTRILDRKHHGTCPSIKPPLGEGRQQNDSYLSPNYWDKPPKL